MGFDEGVTIVGPDQEVGTIKKFTPTHVAVQ